MASHCDCDFRRDLKKELKEVRRQLKRMEKLIMTTKDEVIAKLDELGKDMKRVVADLKTALENKDLEAIGARIDELDAIAEAASPETTEPTP